VKKKPTKGMGGNILRKGCQKEKKGEQGWRAIRTSQSGFFQGGEKKRTKGLDVPTSMISSGQGVKGRTKGKGTPFVISQGAMERRDGGHRKKWGLVARVEGLVPGVR